MTFKPDVPLCFLDTETTSLREDRQIWNVAAIRLDTDGSRVVREWLVDDVDLTHADPYSLKLGHFHNRYLRYGGSPSGTPVLPYSGILNRLEPLVRGAHIIGMVPDFDISTLRRDFATYGLCWASHYHLIDVETLAAGRLGLQPPYRSDDLAARMGLSITDAKRHTALGDAELAEQMYYKIYGIGDDDD